MEPIYLIFAFFIILVASTVKGLTGFGLALISMPLLSFFLPLKFLVPLITIFNLITSAIIVWQNPDTKHFKNEILLSSLGVVGVIAGAMLLPVLSDVFLKKILSVVLVALAIAFLSGYRFKIRNIIRARILAGLTSGFLGGLFSIGGPTMVLFLTSLELDKTRFRVTFSLYSLLTTSVAFIGYFFNGLVTLRVITFALILLPALLAGTWLGGKLVEKLPVVTFRKVCIWITLLSGIMIFVSAYHR
ncbi:MAG TPA: sulfite exporter TauE/SafE family protein [Bacteroidales bacterium]|nr:sulfite exporter TauE/SafE family protein [Bacteroidales bacterium]